MALRGRPRKIRAKKRQARNVFGGAARGGARTPNQIMAAMGKARSKKRK